MRAAPGSARRPLPGRPPPTASPSRPRSPASRRAVRSASARDGRDACRGPTPSSPRSGARVRSFGLRWRWTLPERDDGARADQARRGGVRRRVPGRRRPAGDVRSRARRGRAERVRRQWRAGQQPARRGGPQRRDPRHRHPHRVALRRAAQDPRPRRGVGIAGGGLPRPRAGQAPREARDQRRLRVDQARDHAGRGAQGARARHPGRRLHLREPPLLPGRTDRVAPGRPGQHRQPGHRGLREVHRRPRPRRPSRRRLRARRHDRAGRDVHRPPRPDDPARRAGECRPDLHRGGGDRDRPQRSHRRGAGDGVAPRLRPEQPGRCAEARPPQPDDGRRLRAGLGVQELHVRHGARFRGVDAGRQGRRDQPASLRRLHHRGLPRQAPRAHGARGVHLLVEHRGGEDGAEGRAASCSRTISGASAFSASSGPSCRRRPSR